MQERGNCHDQEHSDVGIRQNPLEKRIAAPVCEPARNDAGLNPMTLHQRRSSRASLSPLGIRDRSSREMARRAMINTP